MDRNKKSIEDELVKLLAQRGFRNARGRPMTLPLNDEVAGWVGLDLSQRGRAFCAIPNVGLRHQGIEKLVSELQGTPKSTFSSPTVSLGVGYLLPEKKHWEMLVETESELVAQLAIFERIVDEIVLPWFAANASLRGIRELLNASPMRDLAWPRRLVAHDLLGEKLELLSELGSAESFLGARSDPYAEMLRRLIHGLRDRNAPA
ncbi:MAG: hypothetical protein IPN34_11955 [Planctomycetes bacterium]|nr:hypothetical protein [Planctomycetota bacterium]